MKLRDAIRMSDAEIAAFLEQPHSLTMCTLNGDNTIHAVAMFYAFIDGALAVGTKVKSQKVRNLRRNPTMTVLIEDGRSYDELRGVELVGRGEIIDDPAYLWQMGVSLFERYQGRPFTEADRPQIEDSLTKRVVVKLHVDKVVSWDHRKLASASASASASAGAAGGERGEEHGRAGR